MIAGILDSIKKKSVCTSACMTGIILQVTPLRLGFVGITPLPDPFTIYARTGSASRRQKRQDNKSRMKYDVVAEPHLDWLNQHEFT